MRLRQTTLKRITICIAAVLPLFVWYLLAGPIVAAVHDEWYPFAAPYPAAFACLEMLFAPINYYYDHPELPGSNLYQDYVSRCYAAVRGS